MPCHPHYHHQDIVDDDCHITSTKGDRQNTAPRYCSTTNDDDDSTSGGNFIGGHLLIRQPSFCDAEEDGGDGSLSAPSIHPPASTLSCWLANDTLYNDKNNLKITISTSNRRGGGGDRDGER